MTFGKCAKPNPAAPNLSRPTLAVASLPYQVHECEYWVPGHKCAHSLQGQVQYLPLYDFSQAYVCLTKHSYLEHVFVCWGV